MNEEIKFDSTQFLKIESSSFVVVDLAYARPENFLGHAIYGNFKEAYLHRLAYEKWNQAVFYLQRRAPQFKFIIYDALRPSRFQQTMFAKVEGTSQESYVANPAKGSLHNYGMALDLSLLSEHGVPLDMGSAFDEFSEKSQPQFEDRFLQDGTLTVRQIENRKILREIMTSAGFVGIPNEWWHFNAFSLEEAKLLAPKVL